MRGRRSCIHYCSIISGRCIITIICMIAWRMCVTWVEGETTPEPLDVVSNIIFVGGKIVAYTCAGGTHMNYTTTTTTANATTTTTTATTTTTTTK